MNSISYLLPETKAEWHLRTDKNVPRCLLAAVHAVHGIITGVCQLFRCSLVLQGCETRGRHMQHMLHRGQTPEQRAGL